MSGWPIAGVMGLIAAAATTAAVALWWMVKYQRDLLVVLRQDAKESERKRDEMTRTALDARGVVVVSSEDSAKPAVAVPPNPFAQVAAKVKALEAGFEKEARDRDERVAEEIRQRYEEVHARGGRARADA